MHWRQCTASTTSTSNILSSLRRCMTSAKSACRQHSPQTRAAHAAGARADEEHTVKGLEMIDGLLAEFQLKSLPYVDTLRNIIEFHHETFDASGYLRGLRGEEIPIEARIVAVADIFDALTSQRPYKVAGYNVQAFAFLRTFAGRKLDTDCVGGPDQQSRASRTNPDPLSQLAPAIARDRGLNSSLASYRYWRLRVESRRLINKRWR